MATNTRENLPPASVKYIDDAIDLNARSNLGIEEARRVVDVLRRFKDDRAQSYTLYVITLDDWAYEDGSDYDVADNGVILATDVVDHSERAHRVEGGYEVLTDVLFETDDPSSQALPTLLKEIDHTHTDFVNETGDRFLPKKAVTGVFDLQP